MKQIHILVDDKMYQQLRILLLQKNTTVSSWVRKMIRLFLEKQQ